VDRSGGAPTGLLARGIVGHARGRWYDAALAIGQARGRIGMIGGSQMQRALFEDMLFDSLSRNAQTSRPRVRLYA
jgi:hypothetical protein